MHFREDVNMAYYGMMDGWHGDEYECLSQCGMCKDCDERYYYKCDVDYEQWRDDELAA